MPNPFNDSDSKHYWPPCSEPVTKGDLQTINRKLDHLMSAITDWAAKEEADLSAISATLDTITAGVKGLDDKITALQNSPGTLSTADQAALDAIQADSTALRAKAAAIDTAAP